MSGQCKLLTKTVQLFKVLLPGCANVANDVHYLPQEVLVCQYLEIQERFHHLMAWKRIVHIQKMLAMTVDAWSGRLMKSQLNKPYWLMI